MVDRGGVATTQAHVSHGALGAAAGFGVLSNVVHAGNDAGVGAGAGVIKDLDAVQLGLLGDTVRSAANGTGAVSAVAVAISVLTADKRLEEGSTTFKFLMSLASAL